MRAAMRGRLWFDYSSAPLHRWHTRTHQHACTLHSLGPVSGRRPPASPWILISIWWMWRGLWGVGAEVWPHTHSTHSRTQKPTLLREHCRSWFSQFYSTKRSSILTLHRQCVCVCLQSLEAWRLESLTCQIPHYFVNVKEKWADRAVFPISPSFVSLLWSNYWSFRNMLTCFLLYQSLTCITF